MDWLHERQGSLHAEGVPLADIASTYSTPTYVYSRAAIEGAFAEFARAARHHAELALVRAEAVLSIPADLAVLRAARDDLGRPD